jgi:hypothetical protein
MNTFRAIQAYIQLSDEFAKSRYQYWLNNNLGTSLEWLEHEYLVHQTIEPKYDASILDNLNCLG